MLAIKSARVYSDQDCVASAVCSMIDEEVHEKTMLLKEVHHRVKNNLQVICSLLSMQIDNAPGASCAAALNDAYSRVQAMSLIHEQIYQSESLSDLDFGEYVQALSQRLFATYCVDPVRIGIELSVEPVRIDMQRAIPCGLILSELFSNALKYAFPDGRAGVIRVSLRRIAAGRMELAVEDDGCGLPADLDWQTTPSLGMQVVRTLSRQLRAELSVRSGPGGTSFRFTA
ncbi:MAG TPA: sensor histidine kinase [Bryobacteraceae bacterium]|jgi:two-component sensor histidine kinase